MSDNAPSPAVAPAQGSPQLVLPGSRITITYPTPGNVPGGGTFVCYGTIDTASPPPFSYDAVASDVTNPNTGQVVATGTSVPPDPGYDFKFDYSGVTTNVTLTLTVRALLNGGVVDSRSITITCTSP